MLLLSLLIWAMLFRSMNIFRKFLSSMAVRSPLHTVLSQMFIKTFGLTFLLFMISCAKLIVVLL